MGFIQSSEWEDSTHKNLRNKSRFSNLQSYSFRPRTFEDFSQGKDNRLTWPGNREINPSDFECAFHGSDRDQHRWCAHHLHSQPGADGGILSVGQIALLWLEYLWSCSGLNNPSPFLDLLLTDFLLGQMQARLFEWSVKYRFISHLRVTPNHYTCFT